MRFIANSRIPEGVTPDELAQFFEENGFSTSAWDLVRHRVVTDYVFKVGDVPGIVLFMEADSAGEASRIVTELPAVQKGMLTFELDPLGMAI